MTESQDSTQPIPPDLDVDPAWLAEMAAKKPQFVVRLFTVFCREEPKRLEEMNSALAAGDLPRIKYLAHSLKGAAATLACWNLRDACLRLEKAALASDPLAVASELDQVAGHMTRVLARMHTHLASQPPA